MPELDTVIGPGLTYAAGTVDAEWSAPAVSAIGAGLVLAGGTLETAASVSTGLVTPTGGTTGVPLSVLAAKIYPIEGFGPHADGVTDDAAIIQAALNEVSALGGGTLFLGPHRYLIGPSGITIPPHVVLMGNFALQGEFVPQQSAGANDYSTTPYTLILDPAGTITKQGSSGLSGICLQRRGLTTANSIRDAIALWEAMQLTSAGTAITIAGDDTSDENLFILGFYQAWHSLNWSRHHVRNLEGDNWNGIYLDGSGDTSRIEDVHFWNYLTGGTSWTVTQWSVAGAANNGAGLIRITTATAHTLLTGDTVNVAAVGGVAGANNRWVVTVVDTTHFDLQGSSFAGPAALSASIITGSFVAVLAAANPNVSAGQTVSGSGIPGGTTVRWVSGAAVGFSAAATATNATASLAFANAAYTSGGNVIVPATWLRGTALACFRSTSMVFANIQSFGPGQPACHLGDQAIANALVGCAFDTYRPGGDPNTIGYQFDGDGVDNTVVGGWCGPFGTQVLVNQTNNGWGALTLVGVSMGEPIDGGPVGAAVMMMAGRLNICGGGISIGAVYVADATALLQLAGVDPGIGTGDSDTPPRPGGFWFQNPGGAGAQATYVSGAPFAGGASIVTPEPIGGGTSVALVPSGAGGVQAGTGGNTRGQYSVDWQTSRTTATQVAAATGAAIVGGQNNEIAAAHINGVAGGNGNTLSGPGFGGVAFGYQNLLSGTVSAAPGGYAASDRGEYGKRVFASGAFGIAGDCQDGFRIMRGISTGGAAVRLLSDGGANPLSAINSIPLPTTGFYELHIRLLASDASGASRAVFEMPQALISCIGGTLAIDGGGTFTAGVAVGAAMALPTLAADATHRALNLTCTPPNTDQWNFQARVWTGEMTFVN